MGGRVVYGEASDSCAQHLSELALGSTQFGLLPGDRMGGPRRDSSQTSCKFQCSARQSLRKVTECDRQAGTDATVLLSRTWPGWSGIKSARCSFITSTTRQTRYTSAREIRTISGNRAGRTPSSECSGTEGGGVV